MRISKYKRYVCQTDSWDSSVIWERSDDELEDWESNGFTSSDVSDSSHESFSFVDKAALGSSSTQKNK